MFKKLRLLSKRISLSNKLVLAFYIVVLFPIIIFLILSITALNSSVKNQLKLEIESSISNNVLDINSKARQVENSLNYISNNYSLKSFLKNDLGSYEDVRDLANNNIGPLLYYTMLSNNYISKIELYTKKEFMVLKDLIKKPTQKDSQWFLETEISNQFNWWYDDNSIFVTKSITDDISKEFLGIIKLKIKESIFTDSLEQFISLPANVGVQFNNTSVNFLTSSSSKKERLFWEQTEILDFSKKWSISYEILNTYYKNIINQKVYLVLLILVIIFLLVSVAIKFISDSLLKRIFILTHQMKMVQQGSLDIRIDTTWDDEVGILERSFSEMIERIKFLINEVYKSELKQKELEIELLKEKINPHFLYNILSTINWIAIDKKEEKISEIVTDLATFYRTSLNNGKNTTTLEKELANIKAYLNLQLVAHDNSFDVEYQISYTTLAAEVPSFILQPLVENAIIHGINRIRSGPGKIIISVTENEKIITITIINNSTNLIKIEKSIEISSDQFGYGLKNVSQRLNLFFKKEVPITIELFEKYTITSFSFEIP